MSRGIYCAILWCGGREGGNGITAGKKKEKKGENSSKNGVKRLFLKHRRYWTWVDEEILAFGNRLRSK